MERCSPGLALGAPDLGRGVEQVQRNLGVTLPAGKVEAVPAVLVPQLGVGAEAQQLLDDAQVPASAGHHQRSPAGQRWEVTQ